ncbi:MAG: hypothetical protein JXA09_17135 [Anaerolineae bacterium]|nr:hypothetical protein [Anaerolineae bacterium]
MGSRIASCAWIILAALVLTACMVAAPGITSIAGAPTVAREGGPVVYTVRFRNSSQEGTFRDAVLTLSYDRYLDYEGEASPRPDRVDTGQRELRWTLGDMGPGVEGVVECGFALASPIPREVYELKVTAQIVSRDAEGKTVTRSRSGVTLIEGHPTPTPTRMPTPTRTTTPGPVAPTGTPVTPTHRPTPTVTPAIAREDCLPYDYKLLDIKDGGENGWYLVGDKGHQMLLLDNKNDAHDALALAQRHTEHCFIGRGNTRPNRLDYIVDYWQGDSGIRTTIPDEDCLPYDPDALRIVDEGKTGWLLTDGRTRILILDDEQDAQAALTLARQYKYHCFIGRGNTRPESAAYIVDYWK